MKTIKPRVVFDYETRSEADLKKVGGIKYAKHHSTEIICCAYKEQGKRVQLWTPIFNDPIPDDLEHYFRSGEYTLVAHNALFEYVITRAVARFKTPLSLYNCTASRAAAHALPRSLEGAGAALGLDIQKDMRGNRLMKKYMKPRPQWTKEGKGDKYFFKEDEMQELFDYCITDTLVEEKLDELLPDLTPTEYRYWYINQVINIRGVTVDTETASKVLKLNKEMTEYANKELYKLTGGQVDSASKRDQFLFWLQDNGYDRNDLRASTVKEVLDSNTLPPQVLDALKIRQLTSMTSNKKYVAMIERADIDKRVKDISLYHGATTGREAARGLQLHNLPRGKIKDVDSAVEVIKDAPDIDYVNMFYESPADVFSSCIRPMVTASPGKLLTVADYNAIECRVLNWVVGNKGVIDDFKKGRDPYIKMASRIFNKKPETITGDERFLGKTAELGCGYQMGDRRFYDTCIEWGVPNVTKDLAKVAVKIYRDTHQPVVKAWSNHEKAAIKAVKHKGTGFKVGLITWFCKDIYLYCKLPSGRCLSFPNPEVRNEPTPWGEVMPKLYYWRIDTYTKKWVCKATYGGSLVESICQGTARDITMNGINNAVKAGYNYLFQCHDEIISEVDADKADLETYIKLISTTPKWAKSLPVKADGWVGFRYKK